MNRLERAETPDERIARLESTGDLVPDCRGCREHYEAIRAGQQAHAPGHKPSRGCGGTGRPHCTCDTCW